jgi:hypothetical protein
MVFCQQDSLTKVYFKVKADCYCIVQFARQDTPAGKTMKMVSDSFLIAIDKETTGFYIRCGKSKPTYIKIPYTPGDIVIKAYLIASCDAKKAATFTIEQFPSRKI